MDEDEKQLIVETNKVKTLISGGHLAYEIPLDSKKKTYSPQEIESNIYKALYGTSINFT